MGLQTPIRTTLHIFRPVFTHPRCIRPPHFVVYRLEPPQVAAVLRQLRVVHHVTAHLDSTLTRHRELQEHVEQVQASLSEQLTSHLATKYLSFVLVTLVVAS